MKKFIPVFIFLIILLAGLLTFDNYGQSWDEDSLQTYATKSLNAYSTWREEGIVNLTRDDLAFYGPAYVMLVEWLAQTIKTSFHISDVRHLIYFLTYFFGALAFYSIAKRWLSENAALGATLLFATQPLLWGHAFINPKDTPFLSLFLISIALGFKAFDSIDSNTKLDKKIMLLTTFWLVSVFGFFLFTQAIHDYIATLVMSAQAGNTNIISLIAKNISGVSADVYTQRYFLLFLQIRTFYFLLSTFLLLFVYYRSQPNLLKTILILLPAGIFLGFATSTRILGPFAGLIVTHYAFRNKGKSALLPLTIYLILSLIFTYITWPYLWMNPIAHFVESFREMSLYPWTGTVLFNGVSYPITDLPFSYLPVLFGIQFSEAVWVLTIVGVWLAIRGQEMRGVEPVETKRGLIELFGIWFLIPFLAFIIFKIALYDNFRQILFLVPPIFLMAGMAFERIKNVKWQTVLVVLCLIPNIFGIVKLHPYEYIYYNTFAGDTSESFENDYWAISYREAAEYVNGVASPNANIWVEGPAQLFTMFAREDLKIFSSGEIERAESYEYVVSTTRYDLDKKSYPDAEVIYEIKRGNAVLTVIKKP
ncbi:MAG: hypothetical protein JNK81_00935 [Anaerolineales bacterium]|nr:hypothetical protein [Anaerolineales bacterium]